MDFTKFSNVAHWASVNNQPLPYALALFAQAMHETGRFTSNIFLNARNAFGMRVAQKRSQNRNGIYESNGNGSFASYSSVEDSFIDRINLDTYNRTAIPTSYEQIPAYMNEVLRKGYAPDDSNYYNLWLNWINEIAENSEVLRDTPTPKFKAKTAILGGSSLLLVGGLVYLFRKKIPFLKNLIG